MALVDNEGKPTAKSSLQPDGANNPRSAITNDVISVVTIYGP